MVEWKKGTVQRTEREKEMIITEIREALKQLQDTKYREFQIPTIPTVKPESIIGVRTPELRKLAKQYGASEEIGVFLEDLPHLYFEENQLHAFMISGMKDYRLHPGTEPIFALCGQLGHLRPDVYQGFQKASGGTA